MRSIILFAFTAVFAGNVLSQTEQDHAAHHPDGSSAPTPAVRKNSDKAHAETTAKGKKAAVSPSARVGVGTGGGMANMKDMHNQMHKPGEMHNQMHDKDAKMMDGQMSSKPPASAASK